MFKIWFICHFINLIFLFLGLLGDSDLIAYNAANNATLESHYLFQFYFPGNKLDHLVCVYTLNVLFIWPCVLYNCVTHMLIVALFVFAVSQLDVLRIRMSNYEIVGRDLTNCERKMILKDLISSHLYLIR